MTRGRPWACAALLAFGLCGGPVSAAERWQQLPATPMLPRPVQSGLAPVDGIRLWYAVFNADAGKKADPVVLVHGGLANASYWGRLVPVLARDREVIVLDSRGHGRSTRDARPIGYDLMSDDVAGLLDFLHVRRAALVGWSDGAIIGLDLAIHHPDRLSGVFAFAANSDPSGVRDVGKSPVFQAYEARAAQEYAVNSPTPTGFKPFLKAIGRMWEAEPRFSDADLAAIRVPVWIVDGDHDEAILRDNTDHMASVIPGAREVILPDASHFAFLQDPDGFGRQVQAFLASLHP